MRVQVPVNMIRTSSAFRDEQFVLDCDLPGNFLRVDFPDQGTPEQRLIIRQLAFRQWQRHWQPLIGQAKMEADVHLCLVREQPMQRCGVASFEHHHAGNRAQFAETAKSENRPVDIFAQAIIIGAYNHFMSLRQAGVRITNRASRLNMLNIAFVKRTTFQVVS